MFFLKKKDVTRDLCGGESAAPVNPEIDCTALHSTAPQSTTQHDERQYDTAQHHALHSTAPKELEALKNPPRTEPGKLPSGTSPIIVLGKYPSPEEGAGVVDETCPDSRPIGAQGASPCTVIEGAGVVEESCPGSRLTEREAH